MVEHLEQFEVLAGRALPAGAWPLMRLRGRGFREVLQGSRHDFKQPFDPDFGKMMVKAASFVLSLTDLDGVYGFAEHRELSLLFRRTDGQALAHELLGRTGAMASAKLSLLLGEVVSFDASLYAFPNPQLVLGYFRWRQHQMIVRTLDGYCTHVLLQSGADPADVPKILGGMGAEEKVEILGQNDIDYSELPLWQRRGTGIVVREEGSSDGAARLLVDTRLPEEEAYATYLRPILG